MSHRSLKIWLPLYLLQLIQTRSNFGSNSEGVRHKHRVGWTQRLSQTEYRDTTLACVQLIWSCASWLNSDDDLELGATDGVNLLQFGSLRGATFGVHQWTMLSDKAHKPQRSIVYLGNVSTTLKIDSAIKAWREKPCQFLKEKVIASSKKVRSPVSKLYLNFIFSANKLFFT